MPPPRQALAELAAHNNAAQKGGHHNGVAIRKGICQIVSPQPTKKGSDEELFGQPKAGYLEKRSVSGVRKRWQKRYFRTNRSYLQYYKNESSARPLAAIDLRLVKEVRVALKGQAIEFELTNGILYKLRSSTREAAEEWANLLSERRKNAIAMRVEQADLNKEALACQDDANASDGVKNGGDNKTVDASDDGTESHLDNQAEDDDEGTADEDEGSKEEDEEDFFYDQSGAAATKCGMNKVYIPSLDLNAAKVEDEDDDTVGDTGDESDDADSEEEGGDAFGTDDWEEGLCSEATARGCVSDNRFATSRRTAHQSELFTVREEPLPHPWQEVIDEATSVLYYWNQENNAAQYERPNVDGSNWQDPPPAEPVAAAGATATKTTTEQGSTKGLSARDQWRKILMKAQQEKKDLQQQKEQQEKQPEQQSEQQQEEQQEESRDNTMTARDKVRRMLLSKQQPMQQQPMQQQWMPQQQPMQQQWMPQQPFMPMQQQQQQQQQLWMPQQQQQQQQQQFMPMQQPMQQQQQQQWMPPQQTEPSIFQHQQWQQHEPSLQYQHPPSCAHQHTDRSSCDGASLLTARGASSIEATVSNVFSLARHNRYDQLEQMLNGGSIHVDIKDAHGNSMLAVACQNGNKKVAKVLIRKNADLNSKNLKGNTPLHFCYAYGFGDSLGQYLISKGADSKIENDNGTTCFKGF
jgi:hypothetical protein